MTGQTRRTAVTAVAASLGLTGVVLLAAAPMFTASASSRTVTVANPGGGTIDPVDPTVDVTETVTVTAEPTETADPVVTMTMTVTPQPTVTRTKTVRPSRQPTSDPQSSRPAASQPPVLPTSGPATTPDAGQDTGTGATASPTESPLTLAPAASETPNASAGVATSFEEPAPESVPYEIRNASPEYDQIAVSKQLAVPGILMVLLVVFAVFLFQGRLQRMAHAAAIRRAGPRPAGKPGGGAAAHYPATPAYAPIISFVPLQPYPMPPAQGTYPPGYTMPQTGQPPQPGQPYAPGQTFQQGQPFQQGQAFQQGQPTQPAPGFGGYAFPQTGPQAGSPAGSPMGGPQPGQPGPHTGPQTGQAFQQQPYQTGQWSGPSQPWSGAPTGTGPLSGPGAFPGASGPGVGAHQGEGLGQRPSNDPSSGWYGPRPERPLGPERGMGPRLGEDDPRHRGTGRDEDDEPTSLFYDPPPRLELESGPTSIPGPPVETVSVERIGPDGQPMDHPPLRGTRVFPVQDDPGGPYPSQPDSSGAWDRTATYPTSGNMPTMPDPGAGEDPPPQPEDDKKRRPWRRSR